MVRVASAVVSLPRPSTGVAWVPFGEDLVLYDPVAGRVHLLNATGRHVWEACATDVRRADLVAGLADASGADPGVVAEGVSSHVAALEVEGLLGADAWAESEDPQPIQVARGHRSRSYGVIDEVVAFWSDDGDLVARVDDLLGDPMVIAGAEPTVWFALDVHPDGSVRVSGPGVDRWWTSVDAVVEVVASLLNGVAAASATCLVLHAAAVVTPSGEVVVLPAVSGSGKSTLTAALVSHGWGYVTDEAVGVRAGTLEVMAYAKPLSLDATSRAALDLGPGSESVPVAVLAGGEAVTVPGPVTRIVLPRYVADATVAVHDLGPDAALAAVAEHALNLRVVGVEGLAALADLARGVACHELVHGGGPTAIEAVRALAEGGTHAA